MASEKKGKKHPQRLHSPFPDIRQIILMELKWIMAGPVDDLHFQALNYFRDKIEESLRREPD